MEKPIKLVDIADTTCEYCGIKVEPGMFNWIDHYEKYHLNRIQLRMPTEKEFIDMIKRLDG